MSPENQGKTLNSPRDCVWVLDSDANARSFLQRLLERHRINVAGFSNVRAFFGQYRRGQAQCLILESTLPDSDGLTVQRQLAAAGDLLPMVFLAAAADVPTAVQAMKGGAADFILKPYDPPTLLAAVREAIARHKRYQAFQQSAIIVRRLQELTGREREVLDLVVAGFSTKQISARLHRTNKTVEFHRQNIMRKIGATNVADLVRMVTTASHDLNRMNGSTRRNGGERS